MPHQLLQGRNRHPLVYFIGPKRVAECVDTHLFPDASFFDILCDQVFDGGDIVEVPNGSLCIHSTAFEDVVALRARPLDPVLAAGGSGKPTVNLTLSIHP